MFIMPCWLCCLHCRLFHNVTDASTQTMEIPLIARDENSRHDQRRQRGSCSSSLDTAMQLVQRAVAEDRQHNYDEALSLYQHALVYFLETLNYETDDEELKTKILSKCRQYLERAEKLSEYLISRNRRISSSSSGLSEVSKSMSMLAESDAPLMKRQQSTKKHVLKMYQSFIHRKSSENGNKSDEGELKRSNSAKH